MYTKAKIDAQTASSGQWVDGTGQARKSERSAFSWFVSGQYTKIVQTRMA